MEENGRKWTDYTDEEKLLVIDGYLDGVVALDDENEKVNKQRLEWLRGHIPAYKVEGGKNYIFVSYSHLDYKEVYKDLAAFSYNSQRRVRFWYDEGLPIGQDWEKAAGELIKNPRCVGVLFYLSKNLLLSPSVFKEIEYVKNSGKPFFAIALNPEFCSAEAVIKDIDEVELDGIRSRLNDLTEFFPNNNTALPYSLDNVSSRVDRIAREFDVTEEVFSDFVCEEIEGGLNLVAYCGNKTEVHIPERIGGKNIVEIAAEFPNAVSVYIPKTVNTIVQNIFDSAVNLEEINVDKDNLRYYDINGVLCQKVVDNKKREFKVLLRAPIRWDWIKQFKQFEIVERQKSYKNLNVQLKNILNRKNADLNYKNKTRESQLALKVLMCQLDYRYFEDCRDDYISKFDDLFSFALAYLKGYAKENTTELGYAIIHREINVIYKYLKKLKSCSIFSEIKIINRCAFYHCEKLDYLFLHDSIELIDVCALMKSSLKLIFLPNSLEKFYTAFTGCTQLQSVLTETDYYETHEESTFNKVIFYGNLKEVLCSFDNTAITGIEFKKGVEARSYDLAKCSWLTQITLPYAMFILNINFKECFRLSSVTFADGIRHLSRCRFNDCISLKSIRIPRSVQSMDDNCFLGCANLQTIKYGGTIEEWNKLEENLSGVASSSKPWKCAGKGVRIICTDGVIEPSYED